METFSNPLEDVFGWISLFYRFVGYTLFGGNVVDSCPPGATYFCIPFEAIFAALLLIAFFIAIWLIGYRINIFLAPFSVALIALLYIQYTFRNQGGLPMIVSAILTVVVLVAIAILLDRYRGIYYLSVIAIAVGSLVAGLLNHPVWIGQLAGAALAFILGIIPAIRKAIDGLFSGLVALVSGLVGGVGLVIILAILGMGIVNDSFIGDIFTQLYTTFLGGVVATIIAFGAGIFAFIALLLAPYMGIKVQLDLVNQEMQGSAPNKLSLISVIACLVIVIFTVTSANLIDPAAITVIPVASVPSGSPLAIWQDFQNFSGLAIRPWYRYPWETAPTNFTAYLVEQDNGLDGLACPQISCAVVSHFYAGEISRDDDVGFLGINGQGNYLDTVTGDRVRNNDQWYVFLNDALQAVYVPVADVERRTVPPRPTP